MTDPQRRPILSLKVTPARFQAPPVATQWKCKPCGARLAVDPAAAPAEVIRCPACNARLGRAEQFHGESPPARARRA